MNYICESEVATRQFGERIGVLLRGGEVIELVGDVGAGKTTLTKGIALGMGITEPIQSPTFTISRVYDAPHGLRLNHYDFYRLQDAGIMKLELQEAANDPLGVTIIEWGDIVADVLPADHLMIRFEPSGEAGRTLEVVAHGTRSQKLVGAVA